jgi:hypothetical protein
LSEREMKMRRSPPWAALVVRHLVLELERLQVRAIGSLYRGRRSIQSTGGLRASRRELRAT